MGITPNTPCQLHAATNGSANSARSTTPRKELQNKIGTLGWVLWLIQQRKRKAEVFRQVLTLVVRRVEGLHDGARGRWEHLLWFAHALVYHTRELGEGRQMVEFIRENVRKSERTEMEAMGKTFAEVIQEEGEAIGALNKQRETLLRQLRLKFKRVPAAIEAEINATHDVKKLDDWLDEIVSANSLAAMRFTSRS